MDFFKVAVDFIKALGTLSVAGIALFLLGVFVVGLGIFVIYYSFNFTKSPSATPPPIVVPIPAPLPSGPLLPPREPQAPVQSPPPISLPPAPPGYVTFETDVVDKNGKSAKLIKIVSQEYNWVIGRVDQVEFNGRAELLSSHFQKEGIRQYLEQLDAIVGVGTSSNETVDDNIIKEENRALDRAKKIQHDIKETIFASWPAAGLDDTCLS